MFSSKLCDVIATFLSFWLLWVLSSINSIQPWTKYTLKPLTQPLEFDLSYSIIYLMKLVLNFHTGYLSKLCQPETGGPVNMLIPLDIVPNPLERSLKIWGVEHFASQSHRNHQKEKAIIFKRPFHELGQWNRVWWSVWVRIFPEFLKAPFLFCPRLRTNVETCVVFFPPSQRKESPNKIQPLLLIADELNTLACMRGEGENKTLPSKEPSWTHFLPELVPVIS